MTMHDSISLAPWMRRGTFVSDCTDTLAGMTAVVSRSGDVIGAFTKREDAAVAAAAPALLAALQWAVGMAEEAILVREEGGDPDDTEEVLSMHRAELQTARNVIAALEVQARG